MRYLVLACDYDGTLAHGGRLHDDTIGSLKRCAESGRKLVMVTGRELDDLMKVCPHLELFEWVVAENGALLYRPSTRDEKPLAGPPPPEFIQALTVHGVCPCSSGRVIVSTWQPHETKVLAAIRDFGLELQVIFNKGAVMILPSGVNKATGLLAALDEMGLSPHNVVSIGDAENDHSLLAACEACAAVANALPLLKERADLVTSGDHGAGVSELIEMLIADDLASLEPRLTRHDILMGHDESAAEIKVRPYRSNLLIAGSGGAPRLRQGANASGLRRAERAAGAGAREQGPLLETATFRRLRPGTRLDGGRGPGRWITSWKGLDGRLIHRIHVPRGGQSTGGCRPFLSGRARGFFRAAASDESAIDEETAAQGHHRP